MGVWRLDFYVGAHLSLSGSDSYLETAPTAYRFYKEHWEYRRFRCVIAFVLELKAVERSDTFL